MATRSPEESPSPYDFLPRNNWLRQFFEASYGMTGHKECLLRRVDFATPAVVVALGSWVLTGLMLKEVLPAVWPTGNSYSYGYTAELLLDSTEFLVRHWYVTLLIAAAMHLLWRKAKERRMGFTAMLWMLAVLSPLAAATFAFAAFAKLGSILQD